MESNDSPAPLSVKTTVAELEIGDLFLPVTRETLAMNIPVIEFIGPVEDGISVRGMERDDVFCVILKGEAEAKLMESGRTVFRALRPGEQRSDRTVFPAPPEGEQRRATGLFSVHRAEGEQLEMRIDHVQQ